VRTLWLVTLALGSTACSLPRSDRFFIRNAALAEPAPPADSAVIASASREEREVFPVRGHRITTGSSVILAFRQYSPGSWLAIDDERFEKVNISLPEFLLARRDVIDLASTPGVIVRYSSGGSAWPRSACFGTASSGHMRILRSNKNRIHVDLVLELSMARPREACGGTKFRRRAVLERHAVSRLTPWQGKAGKHVYAETYPRGD
jgi:hypothetical protein